MSIRFKNRKVSAWQITSTFSLSQLPERISQVEHFLHVSIEGSRSDVVVPFANVTFVGSEMRPVCSIVVPFCGICWSGARTQIVSAGGSNSILQIVLRSFVVLLLLGNEGCSHIVSDLWHFSLLPFFFCQTCRISKPVAVATTSIHEVARKTCSCLKKESSNAIGL